MAEEVLGLEPAPPFDDVTLLGYLGLRALPGVEERVEGGFRRAVHLEHGPGLIDLRAAPGGGVVVARLRVSDARDLPAARSRCKDLIDHEADPVAIDAALARDPVLAPLVARRPGLRVPGHVDGFELAVRAVLGQQISVAGARTLAARLVAALGTPLPAPVGTLTHLFPEPGAVADADLGGLGLTGGRIRALHALAAAVADGTLRLDRGADPVATTRGSWACPASDRGRRLRRHARARRPRRAARRRSRPRRALERLGHAGDPRALAVRARPGVPGGPTAASICGPACCPAPGTVSP
jgi:AraC family transcriptional regulator of adaptative response / DNA-3-methyladenine glycosylase II